MHKHNFVVVPQTNVHFPKKGIWLIRVLQEIYNTSRIAERIFGSTLTDVQGRKKCKMYIVDSAQYC